MQPNYAPPETADLDQALNPDELATPLIMLATKAHKVIMLFLPKLIGRAHA
jgi:hypothetical protein